MKQWLTILLLIWATATLQSAGEKLSAPCKTELRATVIAPESEHPALADDSPLLATSSTAARQLSGTGSATGKSTRYPDTVGTAALHPDVTHEHAHVFVPENSGHDNCPLSLRGGGRYIYFLRRIII